MAVTEKNQVSYALFSARRLKAAKKQNKTHFKSSTVTSLSKKQLKILKITLRSCCEQCRVIS